jgi:hypothetical protein
MKTNRPVIAIRIRMVCGSLRAQGRPEHSVRAQNTLPPNLPFVHLSATVGVQQPAPDLRMC